MATIPQKQIFCWEEIESLGDLERLLLVIRHLPDEALMAALEWERGKGRNDYPVRAVWNSILAGVVYQHGSIESLRRELLRNGQLRQVCGFNVLRGESAVPPSWVYTRFLKRLLAHRESIEVMFDALVGAVGEALPGFGKVLAVDGKAIRTHAGPPAKDAKAKPPDGRRDTEADFGAKRKKTIGKDGTLYERVTYWFGYKLHLVVDATYDLPVAREVTKASCAEQPEAHQMIKKLAKRHGKLLETCEMLTADKGYDDTKLLKRLWDKHEIRPVIPIRDDWPKDEPTRRVSHLRHVVYNQEGEVFCWPRQGAPRRMAFGGFEEAREALKYRCPARQYGTACQDKGRCPSCVRIPLRENRRVFLPLARSTYRWERAYKKRSAAERVNSRLDVSFGFENHFIRGMAKMRLRVDLALIVMLAMALGRTKEKQREKLRSLVQAA
ncbi:MAG: transposase [Kiritimatiellae bacterium]|nr:transposase [Kiritimatiellia bacterium]